LFSDADQAVKSIDTAAASIKKLSDTTDTLVDSDGRRTFRNAADAAADIKDVANQTKAMIAKLQGPTTDFAANGLPALTSAVASLQQAADSLNRLASQLEESPTALISKPPAKEVQVKP
jgi:phospholipid/cholesterol/gamma-HCH transport system substrate-binding protein